MQKQKKYLTKKNKLIYLGVILICASLLLVILGAVKIYLNSKILPRTMLLGANVGFLDAQQLEDLLEKINQKISTQGYTVNFKDQEIEVSGKELGIEIDFAETKIQAPIFNAKRDQIFKVVKSLATGQEMNLKINLNEEKFLQTIAEKFQFKQTLGSNAGLVFNEQNQLVLAAATQAASIDLKNVKSQLEELINGKRKVLAPITAEGETGLTEQELADNKEELLSKLAKNVRLEFANQSWQFKPMDTMELLSFEKENYIKFPWLPKELPVVLRSNLPESADYQLRSGLKVTVNEGLSAYLDEEIAKSINKEMQKIKIYYDEKDNIIIEGTAENGQEINKRQLQKMLALSINNKLGRAPIPVAIIKAQVDADERLAEQGIKEMIGVGYTTFFGSPNNRIHNIAVGTKKYDGLLIKQGEEFSFNKYLGEVDASTGYLPELVIKGKEGTVPEYGGGLCQVSSTVYRAALFAGLPITERAAHSYAVSYYAQVLGYGLDATIYPGVRDLKFVNDTQGDIIIQSYAKDGQAYFKFYGTADGRNVRLEGPYVGNHRGAPPAEIIQTDTLPPGVKKQKENAHNGFDATWFRYLTKNGETIKETIFSNYRAVPAKVMVGAGEIPLTDTAPNADTPPELSS